MNTITIDASPYQLIPDHTDAGRQYEHLCTELVIRLGAGLTDAAQYHLLFKQPSGRSWITEELISVDNVIIFPLPKALTEEYGPIEVQLRVFEEDDEGGWKLKYTPIITPSLYIARSIHSPFDEIPEDAGRGLLEDVTQLVNDAVARADAAQIAAAQAEGFSVQAASEANEARLAAQQAENAVAYCESLVGITAAIKATLGVV